MKLRYHCANPAPFNWCRAGRKYKCVADGPPGQRRACSNRRASWLPISGAGRNAARAVNLPTDGLGRGSMMRRHAVAVISTITVDPFTPMSSSALARWTERHGD
jgi:hypothetical protein